MDMSAFEDGESESRLTCRCPVVGGCHCVCAKSSWDAAGLHQYMRRSEELRELRRAKRGICDDSTLLDRGDDEDAGQWQKTPLV